jgi:amidase
VTPSIPIDRVDAFVERPSVLAVGASEGPLAGLRLAVKDMPGMDPDAYAAVRLHTLCLAGLAGAPMVALPLAHVDGLPLGLAVVGAPGRDRALLDVAARVALNDWATTTAP